MRRTFVFISTLLLAGVAFADMCTDITAMYQDRIRRLAQETQAAVSLTSDPAEQQAIRDSYELQKTQLEMERDSVLASSNCGGVVQPPVVEPPLPTPTPSPTPTPPGTPEDPDNETKDPGTTGECQALMADIKAEALTKGGSGFSGAAQFVHSRRAEIIAVCGNYGKGRRQVGGRGSR